MAATATGFVGDVGLALAMAAGASLVARRLGVPSVVAYLGAGMVLGPYLPIPIAADAGRLHALSEFGVVLVMFAVGLELRLRRLAQVLPASGVTGLVQMGTMLWVGVTLGGLLGWPRTDALFLGGCLAVSSTMVVSKMFDQRPVAPAVREHVFGVLVLQDVAAVALITAYTALASGADLSWSAFGVLTAGLAGSLVAMTAGGMLFVPRLIRRVVADDSPELLVITATALCFGFALLAGWLGYSGALGAFVAGVLVAESGEAHAVQRAIAPLKEIFAAIFFVSIGMTVDPWLVAEHRGAVAAVGLAVILGQLVSVSVAGLLSGLGLRRSVIAGLSLGQIGEFAFVIAGIGTAAGVVGPALSAVTVAVAVITAFTTPQVVARAEGLVRRLDHALPEPVHAALALHEAALETMRSQRLPTTRLRAGVRALLVDVGLLVVLLVAASVAGPTLVGLAGTWLGLGTRPAVAVVLLAVMLAAASVIAVVVRNARRVADALVERLAPDARLPRPVRTALGLAVLLLVWLGAGVPVVALLDPLPQRLLGPTLLLAVGAGLALALARALRGKDEDVRSATARLVDVLGSASAPEIHDAPAAPRPVDWRPAVESLLRVEVRADCAAVGKSLRELDLRARTGATVVALVAPDGVTRTLPDGETRLAAGQVLLLLGAEDADEAALALLTAPAEAG